MMLVAKYNGTLVLKQYGSYKGKSAAKQALNKCLVFDLVCLEKTMMADTMADLWSCCDLIVCLSASLSMQIQGILEPLIVCMLTIFKDMVHMGFQKVHLGREMGDTFQPTNPRGRSREW